jgi:DNA-binding MarR family transcriptional regulator
MALKGNLQDFTVTHLLNLINLAHKTGTLVVEGSNGDVSVFFSEGKLAYAQNGGEDTSLAGILHKTNRLSTAQYQRIRQHSQAMSDKELGLLLINGNYFTQQDILASLQAYFVDILDRLFTWAEGFFHFDADVKPPVGKITVRVNLENIILEGSRRNQEYSHLQDEIPSLEMALRFVDKPGTNLNQLRLSPEEWRVISYINPNNTMSNIAQFLQLSDFEMRRIVFSLLQAGFVQMVRPEGTLQGSDKKMKISTPTTPEAKEERKSLIYRLINRIRSL